MRKKNVKRAFALMLTMAMMANTSLTAFAAGWQQNSTGWWYGTNADNSTWHSNGWQWVDGNGDGTAECYYFDANGYMLAGTTTPDGYTVNADGQWVENGTVQKKAVGASNAGGSMGTTAKSSSIKGTVFPSRELKVNDYLIWKNLEGGTDYKLYYLGSEALSPAAAGYQLEWYGQEQCFNIPDSGWVTPQGVTVDYRLQVMENGKVKTATAEELGISYEPGKIRDVPYDSNAPLKRVVDKFALNIENMYPDSNVYMNEEFNHHGLREHSMYLLNHTYIISPLSGQPNHISDFSQWRDWELSDRDAVISVLRDWLNSFDFENASEMERAEKVRELLGKASYDESMAQKENRQNHTYFYRILVQKKGICDDFTQTAHLLATLLGLKVCLVGYSGHSFYIIQVDGVPYSGENGGLDLKTDWRDESGVGSKHYNSGLIAPVFHYE